MIKKSLFINLFVSKSKSVDSCSLDPCKNNGTCSIDSIGNYKCTCYNGYYGKVCEFCEWIICIFLIDLCLLNCSLEII